MRTCHWKLVFIFVGLLLCPLTCVRPAVAQSWSNGYAHRRTITLDHTKVPNTDQTNFPFLFSGTYSYLATTSNGGNVTNSNGYDIIFTSDATGLTTLPFEQESYNASTGAVIYWVQVPTLSHTTDTVIYMFYGNSGVTTDQSNKTAVWDSNYQGVWHFGSSSTLSVADSTSNGYTLTNNNSTPAASGQINGAASFNGSNTYLSNSSLSIGAGSPITVSYWNHVTSAQNSAAFSIGGSDNPNRLMAHSPWSDGNLYWDYGNTSSGGAVGTSYSSALGAWTYVVLEYNPTGTVHSIYLNGSLANSTVSSNVPQSTQTGITIGKWSSFYHNGIEDEFRVSTAARSADWIATEYNNQISPWTFYSVGAGDWSNGYANQRAITIAHTKVPNTDQRNFPVLISGTYSYLATTSNGGNLTNANGYDIVFSSDVDGTNPLAYERESYNATNGAVIFWVQVPTLSHTTDTVIYMFYGNSGVTTDQSNKTAVWDSNYQGVWHFGSSSTLSVADSTSNGYTLTNNNSTPAASGQINGAASFNGSNTYLSNSSLSIGAGSPITVSYWNHVTSAQNSAAFSIGGSDNPNRLMAHSPWSDGNLYWDYGNTSSGGAVGTSYSSALGAWTYVVLEYNPTGTVHSIYLNGSLANSTVSSNVPQSTQTGITIGKWSSFYHNGIEDEFRVSTAARSADWIATEYNSQSSPSSFYSIGANIAVPNLTGLSPNSGPGGTSVTITGTNFGSTQGSSSIAFSGVTSTPTSWSNTQIAAPVPGGTITGNVVVNVSNLNSNGLLFTDTSAGILGISPTSGLVGASVTITGVNFGSTQGSSTVTFNGTAASPTSWSATSIVVPVPSGASSGSVVVTVAGVGSNGLYFIVLVPAISALSPTSGPIGTSVTISGSNFGSTQGSSTVTFNGTAATPTSWSSTQIVVPVPSGASNGNVVVTVSGKASNGLYFSILIPTISGLSPTSGPSSTSVTISGSNFGSTQGSSTVTFNGTAASPTSWSATSIVVPVPSGASSGNVVVTVSGVASNGSNFTVTSPSISSLSPSSGPIGTSVTINGSSFGATQGTSTVTFNGTAASPTSWSATSIVVPVPSGAATGNVVVTVGTYSSNGLSFTVAPSIASLSPTSGLPGTQVTISGASFGATQGTSTVTFNGTAASPTSWSATSIVVVVPVGSTTGNVVVTVSGLASNGLSFAILPTGWLDQDIGTVGLAGSATYSNGMFTVKGAGAGIGGTADGFHFVYQPLSGDGTIVARMLTFQGSNVGVPITGVMIRETLTPGSTNAGTFKQGATGTGFLFGWRPTTSGTEGSSSLNASLPYWVEVTRSGNTFTGYISPDDVNWVQIVSETISMAQNVYIGLAVTNNSTSALGTATFDNVSISPSATQAPVITGLSATTGSIGSQVVISGTGFGVSQSGSVVLLNDLPATINSWSGTSITFTIPTGATSGYLVVSLAPGMINSNPVVFEVTTQPLPSPWLDQDIGNVGVGGSATYSGGTFTLNGAGTQIGGTADGIHFVYQPMSGDGTIVARVASLQNGQNYDEAGVMIRETLAPGATMAFSGFQAGATRFTYRTTTGGSSSSSTGSTVALPYWFMLIRSGNTFKGYAAPDGVNWTQVGSTQTITMAGNVFVGLAVTSTSNSALTAGTFDNESISPTADVVTPVITSLTPPAAPVGGTVTVAGNTFGSSPGSSQLLFNGIAATVTSWSSTSITATVPSNTTSGPVTVTVGGVTSNSVQFSVLEAASITGLSPASGPVGSSVVITGTGFGPTRSNSFVSFYGATATSITSWSDTSITAVVPSGASTGYVTVTVAGVITPLGPWFTLTSSATLTDSLGNPSTYSAKVVGGQWTFTDSQGSGCSTCTARGVIHNTFDSNGNTLSTTDALGIVTTYTYDSSNNLLTQSTPLNSSTNATTTYTYNSFGEVLTVTDPLGNVTTNAYDSHGNLTSVTSPKPNSSTAASVTTFAYNSLGELTSITDPLSHVTNMTYTTAGLIATITDAQNNVTTYGYDAKGNRTSVTDALNHQTTFAYDAMSRLTTITYPDSTTSTFAYDSRGRRTSVTDQNSKTTTYAYDDADRLTSVTDAASHVTYYAYDTEDNLTSISDANSNQTAFTYDAFGRVTRTNFPSSLSENYQYDADNNLTSKTDRKNQTITYLYDALNRLTSKTYPDSTAVDYVYDLVGKIQQVNDPTGTYAFAYDNMGRLIGTTTSYSFLTSRNFTNAYTYDAASNRTGFTDPESGATAYSYDALNRLTSLAPPSAFGSGSFGFTYDALSRRTQMTRPNSVATNYAYDNLSRLSSVLHQLSGSTIDGASYTLDSAGNRTAKTDQLAAVTSNYTYDAIYQLTQVTKANNTTESYSYDPVGNRTASLGVSSYTTNASNELTATSNASYTYDSNGNTLTKTVGSNTTSYTWDFENRLTSVTLPGSAGTVTFKYDPLGRRIEKTTSSTTSIYAYNDKNLIEETNSSGVAVARYSLTENIDEPLAILSGGTTDFYNADGLGSITSLSNSAGTVAQTYTYDSFGKLTASAGSVPNRSEYTGREFDSETGLYYDRARYYDPTSGKFISEDPVRYLGGSNFYAYAKNNTPDLADPLGLSPVCTLVGSTPLGSWTTASRRYLTPWTFETATQDGGPDTDSGVLTANLHCLWQRNYVREVWKTTLYLNRFLCVDHLACGLNLMWFEFSLDTKKQYVGEEPGGTEPGTVSKRVLGYESEFLDAVKCQQMGPPSN
jgi:RHS repeat-associated protein